MKALETHWTLSFLIGTPAWVVGIIALGVLTVLLFRRRYDTTYGVKDFGPAWIGLICLTVVLIAVALSPAGFYPYKAEFHQWRTVEGEVTAIGNRLLKSSDNGISQRYVFTIDGQPYGVDDTRASITKVGDTVRLACKKDWQYAATPGDVCRWASR